MEKRTKNVLYAVVALLEIPFMGFLVWSIMALVCVLTSFSC
jgi:hypothetical protein